MFGNLIWKVCEKMCKMSGALLYFYFLSGGGRGVDHKSVCLSSHLKNKKTHRKTIIEKESHLLRGWPTRTDGRESLCTTPICWLKN